MGITNRSESDLATEEKYAAPGDPDDSFTETNMMTRNGLRSTDALQNGKPGEDRMSTASAYSPRNITSEPISDKPATPQFEGGNDHRARLIVPSSYLTGQVSILSKMQGIIFPYTPDISQEYSASYSGINTVHSNYTQHFYKNSAVGDISITAKFTVQNETDAEVYLSIIHLLRVLTKMKFGDDDNAGSPPPVCRLYAYGDYMFNKTPVVVSSFRLQLPDNVDYFSTAISSGFNISTVPVSSSITMQLKPIYSRNEQLKFTVREWQSGFLRTQGYL